MKKAYIKTFGCQMNVHDSEKMAGILTSEGYTLVDDHVDADFIIYNTCSIREKAEQKFLSDLGRLKGLKKRRPDLKIAVAGCIAQQMGKELLRRSPLVDFVLGPQNLHMLKDIPAAKSAVAIEDNPHLADTELPVLRRDRGRAWVNIMYGCNNFCTYCIVPYTRGRERSRPAGNIVSEIQGLAAEGFKEVTLLGQNVNSYADDTDFPGLLRLINGIEGIERIRFVTSHPRDFSDSLIEAMAELEKVCEHIHLPLQSGSDRILAAMNRRYTYANYKEKIQKLRNLIPEVAITTDIITGFPGETKENHQMTLRALKEVAYDGIFAFKYSPRPGTKASKMEGQVPEQTGLERLHEILALQDEITITKNQPYKGTTQEILVEGASETAPDRLTGRTRTNKVVNFDGPPSLVGRLVTVRIEQAHLHSLEGKLIDS